MPWYVHDKGKWYGPFTVGALKENVTKGIILPQMLLRRDDWPEGRPAGDFQELFAGVPVQADSESTAPGPEPSSPSNESQVAQPTGTTPEQPIPAEAEVLEVVEPSEKASNPQYFVNPAHGGAENQTHASSSQPVYPGGVAPARLIRCVDCGATISSRARLCPQCGAPSKIPAKRRDKRYKILEFSIGMVQVFGLIVFGFALIFFLACLIMAALGVPGGEMVLGALFFLVYAIIFCFWCFVHGYLISVFLDIEWNTRRFFEE